MALVNYFLTVQLVSQNAFARNNLRHYAYTQQGKLHLALVDYEKAILLGQMG